MKWTSQLEGGDTWTLRWGSGKFRVSRRGGTIDHGPATFTGGPFRYSIAGSVSETGMVVEVASENAHVSVGAPPADACQLLAGLADYFLNAIVKGPFEIPFELGPGDRSAQISYSTEEGSMEATIRRVK